MAYRTPAPEPEPDWHCKTCGAPCMECDHAGSWPATGDLAVLQPRAPSMWVNVLALFLEILGVFV